MYKREIAEIQKFLKEIKKSNIFLSPKDKKIILYLLKEKKLSVDKIKALILKEIKKYPSDKRRKISLYQLLKDIKESNSKNREIPTRKKEKKAFQQIKRKQEAIPVVWKRFLKEVPKEIWENTNFSDELSILELKNKLINYYWKNLGPQEKEKIKQKALLKIKKMKLPSKVDRETLKSVIAEIIKEKYKIPD